MQEDSNGVDLEYTKSHEERGYNVNLCCSQAKTTCIEVEPQ